MVREEVSEEVTGAVFPVFLVLADFANLPVRVACGGFRPWPPYFEEIPVEARVDAVDSEPPKEYLPPVITAAASATLGTSGTAAICCAT